VVNSIAGNGYSSLFARIREFCLAGVFGRATLQGSGFAPVAESNRVDSNGQVGVKLRVHTEDVVRLRIGFERVHSTDTWMFSRPNRHAPNVPTDIPKYLVLASKFAQSLPDLRLVKPLSYNRPIDVIVKIDSKLGVTSV
jgi:hypothetical protein